MALLPGGVMRGNLVFLIALCVFLVCCDQNGAPSASKIEAALNEVAKAKNPEAVVKLNSVAAKGPFYVEFTFSCTNCVIQHTNSPPFVVPSTEGHGMVTLNARLQKWKFDRIIVTYGERGLVHYESDHIF